MKKRRYRLLNQAGDGAPAGGGAAPATPPAAPGGTPPATPPAGGAPATPPAESQNSNAPWTQSIADEEVRKYAEGKGFQNAGDVAKALRELESKTAAPADAAAYQLPVPDGDNGEFAKVASGWFHKAGIPVDKAQALATEWNNFQAAQVAARQAEGARQLDGLKTEWGQDYAGNVETGRKAMKAFGVPDAVVEKLSGEMGDAATIKLFSQIGKSISESTLNPGAAGSTTNQQSTGNTMKDIAQDLYG